MGLGRLCGSEGEAVLVGLGCLGGEGVVGVTDVSVGTVFESDKDWFGVGQGFCTRVGRGALPVSVAVRAVGGEMTGSSK